MLYRLQNEVPSVYVNKSRDFQLFCRLYDCVNNGVKFDIDSMIYLYDPMRTNNRILTLLAGKCGFFPKRDLNDNMLRYIISAFPYLIKYKGSRRGIEAAIATVLKADNIYANYSVVIDNDSHSIDILVDEEFDRVALTELLNYILPVGYLYSMSQADTRSFTTELDNVNIIYMYKNPIVSTSQVASYDGTIGNVWSLPTYKVIDCGVISQFYEANRSTLLNQEVSVYVKTKDSEIDTNKTYYIYTETITDDRVNPEWSEQYIEVSDPVIEDINDYYELAYTYMASVTTYSYTEVDNATNLMHKKQTIVTVPNNMVDRHSNTLERVEVVGTSNIIDTGTYVDGRESIDLITDTFGSNYWAFNDIGEQSSSVSLTIGVSSTVDENGNASYLLDPQSEDYSNEENRMITIVPYGVDISSISLSGLYIQLNEGEVITVGSRVTDGNGSLGVIVSVGTNYVIYETTNFIPKT